MKDFVGNEVKVGDKVACIEKGYANLVIATVVKLTPQAMKVKYPSWSDTREVLRTPGQVVKI